MKNKSILITGASGQFGQILSRYLEDKNYKVYKHSFKKKINHRYSCDLSDINNTLRLFKKINFDYLINLVANTDIKDNESNFLKSFKQNTLSLYNIISAKKKLNKKFFTIHFSTDHLYNSDGKNNEKQKKIFLSNNYSLNKYVSEKIALEDKNTIVLRTNFFGKSLLKKGLFEWGFNSLKKNKKILGFSDIFFSPLSMQTLCEIIFKLLKHKKNGLFNLGSNKGMSKYNFLKKLAFYCKFDNKLINRIKYSKFKKDKSIRPNKMVMDVKKFEKNFNIKLPNLEDELRKEVSRV